MKRFLLSFLRIILWAVAALFGYAAFLNSFDYYSGHDLILNQFLTGFWRFLAVNVPAISWNASTWGPGLAAFVVATLFLHRWLRRWAARTGRPWSFMTSVCLVLLVPVLFVISFIVPGVLLQWEMLRNTAWVEVW